MILICRTTSFRESFHTEMPFPRPFSLLLFASLMTAASAVTQSSERPLLLIAVRLPRMAPGPALQAVTEERRPATPPVIRIDPETLRSAGSRSRSKESMLRSSIATASG